MTDDRLRRAAAMWRWRGEDRPPFAETPGPDQRSVWDFPRPPSLETVDAVVRVELSGVELAASRQAVRICETASPPTYYIPADDVRMDLLTPAGPVTSCEWKGRSTHWNATVGDRQFEGVAWSYPDPLPPYESLQGMLAFYASRTSCFVGDEAVRPQPGGFYGGWITSELTGPFKGDPGSHGW